MIRARSLPLLRLLPALLVLLLAPSADAAPADDFHLAAEALRAGDAPRALSLYQGLAAAGHETASLDWNRAQAARRAGQPGEAMWALLRARELAPFDRGVAREIDRLRTELGLEPAELAPSPWGSARRLARGVRLDLVAAALLLLSLVFHAVARRARAARWPLRALWGCLLLGTLAASVVFAGHAGRPLAVVARADASLYESASPDAAPLGSLREGEVVPVLAESGDWLRVEDSSGGRGWARREHAWMIVDAGR